MISIMKRLKRSKDFVASLYLTAGCIVQFHAFQNSFEFFHKMLSKNARLISLQMLWLSCYWLCQRLLFIWDDQDLLSNVVGHFWSLNLIWIISLTRTYKLGDDSHKLFLVNLVMLFYTDLPAHIMTDLFAFRAKYLFSLKWTKNKITQKQDL